MKIIIKWVHLLIFIMSLSLLVAPMVSSLYAQDESEEDTEYITVDEDELEPEDDEDIDEIEEIEEIEVDMEEPEPEVTAEPTPQPQPTATPVQSLTMRELYRQGIEYYQQKKYDLALEYLTKSCRVSGGVDWLYGEAHAMRGVIHQFYSKAPGRHQKAYAAYRHALEFDKRNKTARKHVYQVEGK